MGKTYMAKTPPSEFKVTTLENSLLSQQVVTGKGILVPYTNLQLNPYSNIHLDLFCSDNLPFQCTAPSMWLTNSMCRSQYAAYTPTWEGCWLQSSSIHQHDEDHETLGYKTLRCTNTTAFWIERWTKAYVSGLQYACEKLLQWDASAVMALKTILIYV